MVQGQEQIFLKSGEGGGGRVALFLFNFFKVYHFYITLCKIVLCIWRKKIFFCHHNFMKKSHSKLSKNEHEI